ncbi:MAG: ABC transporter permease [Clostridiales bacterium]|nr:ABC transporter permease [Clostridiales bacterium]
MTTKIKNFIASKIFALLVLLAAIVLFFMFASDYKFINPINIRNILNSMVIYTLMAVGVGLLIISGEIDLSPGYVGTFSGVLFAVLSEQAGLPWYLSFVLCLLAGAAFGLFNALLVNKFRLPSFIATLATGPFIVKGLTYILSNGGVITLSGSTDDNFVIFLGLYRIAKFVPVSIILALVVITVYGIILSKSEFGRSVYLIGSNKMASRFAGIEPKKISYILFANSGFLGALAGIVYAGRLKAGNVEGTNTYTFDAIAAAIIGGISFTGGSGTMLGCFIGLLIINSFSNGLSILGVSPYWQSVASGLLLLIALIFDYISVRSSRNRLLRKSGA